MAAAAAGSGRRVVAFGGGHGLAASLAALRTVTSELTAVVTVADDGGSSGRLRQELGVLPPGDLRMALAALAGDDQVGRLWAEVSQHRFPGDGPLGGHAAGNLMLTALVEVLGDPIAALDAMGRLLGAAGRVLPLSPVPLEIVADVVGLDPRDPGAAVEVRGQVSVATTPGQVVRVCLEPSDPPTSVEVLAAIDTADWAVLGPGSWFTSVIPHLLVPEIAKALAGTSAQRVIALNLAPQLGETDGFSPTTHLEVMAAHAPDLEVDVVLADTRAHAAAADLEECVRSLGGRLLVRDIARDDRPSLHDPQRLAAAYDEIFTTTGGDSAWR
jgi:uncharacterized cofD-like protein